MNEPWTAARRRRGGTTSGLVALLVIGVVGLLALGYTVARWSDGKLPADASAAPTAAPAAPTAPPVVFEPADVDLGILPPRRDASTTVTVRNTGDAPLLVDTVKASCKCTTLEDLAGRAIPPGGTADVPVRLKGGEAGSTTTSVLTFVFRGHTPVEVKLRARFRRALQAIPPFLDAMQDRRSGSVEITSLDEEPFRILSMNGAPPQFVDFDPASAEIRNRYTVVWDISGYDDAACTDASGRRMPLFLVFETDHPGGELIELILRHRCNLPTRPPGRRWTPLGKHRVVGRVSPGEAVEVDIPIKWLSNVPPDDRFETVVSETPGFGAELLGVADVDGRQTCRVRLTPPPDYRGMFTVQLQVHASRASAPFLVFGTVREPPPAGSGG